MRDDMDVTRYLYQAAMWRRYAADWDGRLTFANSVVRLLLKVPRAECLRRARVAVEAARRLNQQRKNAAP